MYKSSVERTKDYLANFDQEKILRRLVETSEPVCVDVGANIGQTAERLKTAWPQSQLHCIEPLPEQFQILCENNKRFNNTFEYNFALDSENGEKNFYVNKHQVMLSGLYELNENSKDSIAINNPEPSHSNFLDSETITVTCKTLDTWAVENNVSRIDLLKMDTQGSEPNILSGGTNILKSTKVIVSELIFYDLYKKKNSFYEIEKTLLPLGFELFDIGYVSKNPMTGRTDWVDVIYVNTKL